MLSELILESKKLFKLIVWNSFANLVVRKQGITQKQFHRFLYGKKYGGFASSVPQPLTDESQTGATRERDNERKSFEVHIKMLKKYFKKFNLNERH